ncbi:hypothetical protein pb186bvf_010424 [Paramecium bursaria]
MNYQKKFAKTLNLVLIKKIKQIIIMGYQIEIMVSLKKFTNIDLFKQGFYQIRIGVQNATPLFTIDLDNYEPVTDMLVDQDRILVASNLDENYYYSQGFIVKYEEEQMPLNQACLFRIQQNNDDEPIKIEICLLFTDIKEMDDLRSSVVNATKQDQQKYIESKVKIVSQSNLRIDSPQELNQSYFPIDFDPDHCCLIETQIYSIPQKYKDMQNLQVIHINNYKDVINKLCRVRDQFSKFIMNTLQAYDSNSKNYQPREFIYNNQQSDELQQIDKHIMSLYQDISFLWMDFVTKIFKQVHPFLQERLNQEYMFKLKQRWTNSIKHTRLVSNSLKKLGDSQRSLEDNEYRKKIQQDEVIWEGIKYDQQMIPITQSPMLMKEQLFTEGQYLNQKQDSLHYVILVHGYQGMSYDMRLWKSYLTIKYYDNVRIYSAKSNDNASNKDIDKMGRDLAEEVIRVLQEDNASEFRLSFIGHSLGGIVIRASLKYLDYLKDTFYTYISLASPHVGYASSTSQLIDTGMWMIQKWNKCLTLSQLNQTDDKDIKNTFLYKLSQNDYLHYFKNVVLMASKQDLYVPYFSARLENIQEQTQQNQLYNQKIDNILSKCKKVDRFDVNFKT